MILWDNVMYTIYSQYYTPLIWMMLCILPSQKISSSRLKMAPMDPMNPQLNHIGPFMAAEGGIYRGSIRCFFVLKWSEVMMFHHVPSRSLRLWFCWLTSPLQWFDLSCHNRVEKLPGGFIWVNVPQKYQSATLKNPHSIQNHGFADLGLTFSQQTWVKRVHFSWSKSSTHCSGLRSWRFCHPILG